MGIFFNQKKYFERKSFGCELWIANIYKEASYLFSMQDSLAIRLHT